MANDRFLSEVELAHRWSISTKTLQRWRAEKRGLPYVKLSRTVRYDFHDVITYEQTQRPKSAVADELPRSGPGGRDRTLVDLVAARHKRRLKDSPAGADRAMRVLRVVWNHAREIAPRLPENPVRRLTATRFWSRVGRRRSG